MLVIPIITNNKATGKNMVNQLEIKLKNVLLRSDSNKFRDSDIIVNGQAFVGSLFDEKRPGFTNTIDFIRNNNYMADSFTVTSRRNDLGKRNVYQVMIPMPKVEDGLDSLYNSAVLDLRKEIPDRPKGRIVSLKRIGVGKEITEDKYMVIRRTMDKSPSMNEALQKPEVSKLYDTLSFLNMFDCFFIEDASIEEESLKNMINTLGKGKTNEAKDLYNFYQTAKENSRIYTKFVYLSKLITGEDLDWIKESPQKVKVKNMDSKYDK